VTAPAAPECAAVLARLAAYLDGDLASNDCEALEAHCARCPGCAEIVDGLRQTVGLCREAGRSPLPDAVRQRARASVARLLADRENGES
jgi:anti-sigma factor RsiW